ncbi:MAG: hypothetical protein ACI841_004907 [Planctomycetota bacterium]|jgi:hypothetical protein
MGHPKIDNPTPFVFEPLFVADEEGRPIVAPVVKATFSVSDRGDVKLAEVQQAVCFAGKFNTEEEISSYRLEPEIAFTKPSTDIVLLGHAQPERAGTTTMEVRFEVGSNRQRARVTGDRIFEKGFFGDRISKPQPIDKIPLIYERAFGGWDRTHEKPKHHSCETRNPVGVGFQAKKGTPIPEGPLPNIESLDRPLNSRGGKSTPVGFGFISPDWKPRVGFVGTYDDAWTESRSPLLPTDFDRRYFNAAAPNLIAPSYLKGDELVLVEGTSAAPNWQFRLPGIHAPKCLIVTRSRGAVELDTNLDTVIVDADAMTVTLTWRAFTTLRDGPLDVSEMRVTCANAPAPAGPVVATQPV